MTLPIKPTLKSEWLPLVIVVIAALFGYYFYQHLPAVVVTHWNFAGQADGYSGRFMGALLMPLVLLGMYALFLVLPALDPKRERYQEFASIYLGFRVLILAVMLLVYLATGFANLGYPIQINLVIPFVIGAMFAVLGNYLGKVKPNWFVGIRTPWTMSSENVWVRTHHVGGWAFVLFGIVLMGLPLFPKPVGIGLFIIGILALVLGTTVYSYVIYRQEQRQHPPEQPPQL